MLLKKKQAFRRTTPINNPPISVGARLCYVNRSGKRARFVVEQIDGATFVARLGNGHLRHGVIGENGVWHLLRHGEAA